jgi:hypothetical protein
VVIADVSHTLENPAYLRPQRDCDACNAEAVMAVRDLDERAVERSFQNMLAAMIDFIQTLPEEVFANEVLATWIDDNVGGHYQEHEIR